jgi:6-phosphogluconate dehydrogenase
MNPKAEWGIVGMGVMGTSLSRNFASKGFPLALFNRHLEGVEEKVALHKQQLYPELHLAQPFEELVPFISALASPCFRLENLPLFF